MTHLKADNICFSMFFPRRQRSLSHSWGKIQKIRNNNYSPEFPLRLMSKDMDLVMETAGAHFRDYHLLLDDHGEEIFAIIDDIAERVRKIGGTTIRSIGHIGRLQRIPTTIRSS